MLSACPSGSRLISGYLDPPAQDALAAAVAAVLERAPLYTPRMPGSGKPFSVRMSNCGALGWVSDDLPRLVAVQAAGCAPIVRAFQAGAAVSEPWPDARTVAFGITVPNALGDFLILEALYATGGTAVAVTDEALLADQRAVARLEGSFICPEGAACVTAVRQLREAGWLTETDEVVVLNTGTGLIYPDTMPARVPVLPPSGSIPPGQP